MNIFKPEYDIIYPAADKLAKNCNAQENKIQNIKICSELSHPASNIGLFGIILWLMVASLYIQYRSHGYSKVTL